MDINQIVAIATQGDLILLNLRHQPVYLNPYLKQFVLF
jgi:hypothetical protein